MATPQHRQIIDSVKQRDMRCGGGRYTLFDEITSVDNLFTAWQQFSKGKRKRKDVQAFGLRVEERLFALHKLLRSGQWRHGGYDTSRVADPKPRVIHKARVVDRIVHHAVVQVIEPLFERSFIYDSWSCRKCKGTHAAVDRLHRELARLPRNHYGNVWVLKCDIRHFFASLDHDVLYHTLQRKIADVDVLRLLREIIESFQPGLPLGNLTSQLFANVYMNPVDHFVQEQLSVHRYMRYSDDMMLVHHDPDHLLWCLAKLERYLGEHCKLLLHPYKIDLRRFDHGVDWLGFVLYPGYRVMRTTTRKRLWRRVDGLVQSYFNGRSSYEDLRATLASYGGLVRYADGDDYASLSVLSSVL